MDPRLQACLRVPIHSRDTANVKWCARLEYDLLSRVVAIVDTTALWLFLVHANTMALERRSGE